MNDFFWEKFLYDDAIRLLKKNDVNLDKMTPKERRELIEMVMEDLNDKYRDME